jgi:hypothetical protein
LSLPVELIDARAVLGHRLRGVNSIKIERRLQVREAVPEQEKALQ